MKRFNINLPDELHKKLREEAFAKEISMSSWIVKLLDKGMVWDEKRPWSTGDSKKDAELVKRNPLKIPEKKFVETCKHGSMLGLCKFGCK